MDGWMVGRKNENGNENENEVRITYFTLLELNFDDVMCCETFEEGKGTCDLYS